MVLYLFTLFCVMLINEIKETFMYNERYKSDLYEIPDDIESLKKALEQANQSIFRLQRQSANVHMQLQMENDYSIRKLKETNKTRINALSARISNLMDEREEMLKMMKRLVCSYESDYQFKCKVEDFLRKNTDFRGTMDSSLKLTFEELTDLRGGQ